MDTRLLGPHLEVVGDANFKLKIAKKATIVVREDALLMVVVPSGQNINMQWECHIDSKSFSLLLFILY